MIEKNISQSAKIGLPASVDITRILRINRRRNRKLIDNYDPVKGRTKCPYRRKTWVKWENRSIFLPVSMLDDPEYAAIGNRTDYVKLRCRHDFEFWAVTCVTIRHKLTGQNVPFVLNRPQRKVVDVLESDRLAQRPLRLIMLKARQWGGSTLVQVYFAWIQCIHRTNWHSIICAHLKNTAAVIRGMYSKLLASYPEAYWDGDKAPALKAFEGSATTREIAGRNCQITLTSSFTQETARGLDCSLAHLTEVAFWRDTDCMTPEGYALAVCSGIPLRPYTFIALESTANGVGNYFHKEWVRAKSAKSLMKPVFIPWYEIEMCRSEVTDPKVLIDSMDRYEWELWDKGLTLEMIKWYHDKRQETPDTKLLRAEYPTTDEEAFVNTGDGVFAVDEVEQLRQTCAEPIAVGEVVGRELTGPAAIENVAFRKSSLGRLQVWKMPDDTSEPCRYITVVDVGGRSAGSDYSVIAVIDRNNRSSGGMPEIVAQWRGHIDHDLLGWKAAAIARWYGNALLVVESNTLETEGDGRAEFILQQLDHTYPWVYSRSGSNGRRIGFHTNRRTKTIVISDLIAMVRDKRYVETDQQACNEMLTYQQMPSGAYGAKTGEHDDVLMTRAIGLHVAKHINSLNTRVGSGFRRRHKATSALYR